MTSEERADDLAVYIMHHIDEMYPQIWKNVPRSARTSIRNSIINNSKLHLDWCADEQREVCTDKVIAAYNVAAYTKSITVHELRVILKDACLHATVEKDEP